MSVIISLEGNIGSGKTTLLRELEEVKFNKPHIIIYEQVSEWQSIKNNKNENILELFYKDQEKYSYITQSYILFSRIKYLIQTIKDNPDKIIICERCHLTDLMVFSESLFNLNKLNEIEWKVYNEWHQMICNMFSVKIDAYIYNNVSPLVCLERIMKRSRLGESVIELEYLELLHDKHDKWLQNDNTLVLDGNNDFSDKEERQVLIQSIINYVNGL
jgi:deoxyadenosine/deoxycytidine kinase